MSGLDGLAWPRRTARLTLRRPTADDAAAVYAYRRLEAVGRWLTRIQDDPVRWAADWEQRMPTTVVVEHDGRLIGDTRVVVADAHAAAEVQAAAASVEAELMWAFHPDAHGHGYATETVTALIELCFGELGLRRLVAHCYADNAASWRLMERVGMRREAHFVANTLARDGTWRDFLHYGLLASETCTRNRHFLCR